MRSKIDYRAPVTPAQISMLHVAKSQLGLSEEDYRSTLLLYGGVESSKQLRQEGMQRIMQRFEQLGWQPQGSKVIPMRSREKDGTAQPSEAQLVYMTALMRKAGFTTPSMQEKLCMRGIKKPRPTNKYEANIIIEGIKKMIARGYKAGGA